MDKYAATSSDDSSGSPYCTQFVSLLVSVQCADVYLEQRMMNNDFLEKCTKSVSLTLKSFTGTFEKCFGWSLYRSVQAEMQDVDIDSDESEFHHNGVDPHKRLSLQFS